MSASEFNENVLNACENQDETYPYQYHDATILGPIHEDVGSIPLRLGGGNNRKDKRWPVKQKYATYADLIDEMSFHVVGQKDGPAFLQGNAIGNERNVPAIKELCILGLDVDSGVDPKAVIDRIEKRGLTAIIYTTHSHMKGDTFLPESSFKQFCKKHRIEVAALEYPLAIVKRFLIEERKWESWIINTVSIGEPTQEAEGMGVWLHHDPMPKFRAVFPLAEPYVIAKQGLSQADAVKKWKRKLMGLARSLDLPIDESCLDPSRLFYLPRHKDGAPFGVWVTGGDALDIESVPEGAINGDRQSDTFMQNGEQLAGTGVPEFVVNGNFSLKKWATQTKEKGFDIAAMFDAVAPHKIRGSNTNPAKRTVECPFDHYHSNPQDPTDAGCYVESPSPETGKESFSFQCSHGACKSRDRLEFVAEAVTQGWFTTGDLENEAYRPFIIEETDEEKLAKVEKHIETLTLDTRASDLDPLFASLGSLDIPIARRDGLFDKICAKIGVTGGNDKRSLKSRLTPHVKGAEAKRDMKKATATKEKEREKRAKNGGKPVLSLDDLGFMPCVEASFARMLEINETKARYFDMGGQKVVIRKNERGMVETIPLDRGELLSELDHICDWVDYDKEGNPTPGYCHHRVADDIIYYPERTLPYIERISYTPFFTSTGQLVATDGYHAASGVYCALPPELMNLSVPDEPTPEQVKEAVDLYLDDLLHDFPFNDRNGNGAASRANALALALERYVRAMIAGPVPIYIFDKPVAGTGGSLAAEAIMTAVLGKPPKGKPQKTDENELRKEFTSFLMSGAPFYYMDNVNHKIEGGVWASKITLPEWEDRILGSSRNASFLNHNSTVGTGNKVRLSAEMARRAVFIRQAVKGDPKKRSSKDFKHYPLIPWVLENHAKLVRSALILVQAWIAAGKPAPKKVPHFASFESYAHVIGGILENAGVEGFLSNMRIAKESAYEDKHVEQMLCYEWFKRSGQEIRGIGDPTNDMEFKNGKRQSVSKGSASLITIIRDEGIGVELNWEASTKSQMNALVNWLKSKLDEEVITIAAGLDVSLEIIPPSDRKRNPRGKGNLYRLECVGYDPREADSIARGLWSQWAFDWKDAALQIDAAFAGSPDWSDADELTNGPEAKKKVPPKRSREPRSERR